MMSDKSQLLLTTILVEDAQEGQHGQFGPVLLQEDQLALTTLVGQEVRQTGLVAGSDQDVRSRLDLELSLELVYIIVAVLFATCLLHVLECVIYLPGTVIGETDIESESAVVLG